MCTCQAYTFVYGSCVSQNLWLSYTFINKIVGYNITIIDRRWQEKDFTLAPVNGQNLHGHYAWRG